MSAILKVGRKGCCDAQGQCEAISSLGSPTFGGGVEGGRESEKNQIRDPSTKTKMPVMTSLIGNRASDPNRQKIKVPKRHGKRASRLWVRDRLNKEKVGRKRRSGGVGRGGENE